MKVAVIGCGGIGSYFAEHINRLIDTQQIKDFSFTFFDDDKVEKKNILYQNFLPKHIGSFKTDALEFECLNLNFEKKRISRDNLRGYDLVILCADNNLIRREAYEAYTLWKVPFIDARANGKTVGIFSSMTPNYLNTIDSSSESQSCQNPFQIAKQEIEFGNVIISAVLAQNVLTYVRTKRMPNDLMIHF
jgi:molybdopterin/thiamine biosynthesis adenylyltransferase